MTLPCKPTGQLRSSGAKPYLLPLVPRDNELTG
ncbi:MAG: hypothetical protein AVDCRST_MAG15-1243 [uncultured Rubellimicrobium sp.]|uniref:Uncharacterized protein n=1 Tax=uncultured Rubellimicrobium sp. TaxID=543078 RepID=A0A6J4P4V2_9RHOB|nr:MAG: hypothetical protein AVDCRST_MAG15-1243 [uncultured Rubellimicrobium sp.]